MKSIIKDNEEKFPKLMKLQGSTLIESVQGTIVLVTARGKLEGWENPNDGIYKGTVVSTALVNVKPYYEVGYYQPNWTATKMVDFDGIVELCN